MHPSWGKEIDKWKQYYYSYHKDKGNYEIPSELALGGCLLFA